MSKVVTVTGLALVIIAAGYLVWQFFIPHLTPTKSQPKQTSLKMPKPSEKQTMCVQSLPRNEKIAQKLMVALYPAQLGSEKTMLAATPYVGGLLIMQETPHSSVKSLTRGFKIAPFVAVDQEGGTVQRYQSEGVLPGATDMAAQFSPSQAYDKYLHDDEFLARQGITTNFAPVLGVQSHKPSALPGRFYSSEPGTVVRYATESIKAAQAAGITPVVKHFPGLGSVDGNTDNDNQTTDPLAALESRDLVPYRQLSSLAPDVMVSSAVTPNLTDGLPALWSARAVSLLRSYGYENAVMYSDSLTAKAVPGDLRDAVIKAWQAGIDVALIVQTSEDTPFLGGYIRAIMQRAEQAYDSGELATSSLNASVARILQRKGIDACTLN